MTASEIDAILTSGNFAKFQQQVKDSSNSRVHGNSYDSKVETFLYQVEDAQGNLIKFRMSGDPENRYTSKQLQRMGATFMRILTSGARQTIGALEHWLVERYGGPFNLEPWARTVNAELPIIDALPGAEDRGETGLDEPDPVVP
jgi:hypothetical protein